MGSLQYRKWTTPCQECHQLKLFKIKRSKEKQNICQQRFLMKSQAVEALGIITTGNGYAKGTRISRMTKFVHVLGAKENYSD